MMISIPAISKNVSRDDVADEKLVAGGDGVVVAVSGCGGGDGAITEDMALSWLAVVVFTKRKKGKINDGRAR